MSKPTLLFVLIAWMIVYSSQTSAKTDLLPSGEILFYQGIKSGKGELKILDLASGKHKQVHRS